MNHRYLLLLAGIALCACRSDRDYDRADNDYDTDSDRRAAASYEAGHTKTKKNLDDDAARLKEASVKAGYESLSADDRNFVGTAAPAGLWEVESSRLALTKNISDQHREFAQRMIDDHGKANRELADLVRKKGGAVPLALDGEHQRMLDELRDLDGAEFERRYHDMQVKAHDGAIELFQNAASTCDDAELREFIAATLPTLKEHRRHLDTHGM